MKRTAPVSLRAREQQKRHVLMASKPRSTAANLRVVSAVQAPSGYPAAPSYLSPAMQEWWGAVLEGYDLDRHHVRLLEAACQAWDRMIEARAALTKHGLSYTDAQGCPKARPEI